MFRNLGAAAVLGAALFASSAFAQHHGGGGHGGGHASGGHGGGHASFHAPSHVSSHGSFAPARSFHSPAVHSPAVHQLTPRSNFSSRIPSVSTHSSWGNSTWGNNHWGNNTWRNNTWRNGTWNSNAWNNAWNFRHHNGFHNGFFFGPFFGFYPWPFNVFGYPLYAAYNNYNPSYYDYYGSGYYGAYPYSDAYYGDMFGPDYTPMYPIEQQPQTQAAVADAAHIEVILPDAQAQVWFNGVLTRVTGERRSFASPPLTPGNSYSYDVKAIWNQDGWTMSASRSIQVSAGMNRTVDFRQAGSQQAPATIQDRIIPRP